MTDQLPALTSLDGEVIPPGEKVFVVNYCRYFNEYKKECESVEDCVYFIYCGSEGESLSYTGSEVKNKNGDVVLTYEQLRDRVHSYYEEEDD
jgi:hypothetical protein